MLVGTKKVLIYSSVCPQGIRHHNSRSLVYYVNATVCTLHKYTDCAAEERYKA
jgi:hypothetical protein